MLLSLTFKYFFLPPLPRLPYTSLILSQTYLPLTNFAHEASSPWNCLQLYILPTSTSFILHGAAQILPPVSNLLWTSQPKVISCQIFTWISALQLKWRKIQYYTIIGIGWTWFHSHLLSFLQVVWTQISSQSLWTLFSTCLRQRQEG